MLVQTKDSSGNNILTTDSFDYYAVVTDTTIQAGAYATYPQAEDFTVDDIAGKMTYTDNGIYEWNFTIPSGSGTWTVFANRGSTNQFAVWVNTPGSQSTIHNTRDNDLNTTYAYGGKQIYKLELTVQI